MRMVAWHKQAQRYLARMPSKRSVQVLDAVDALAAAERPVGLPGVKEMSGDWHGWMRLRVGGYRVIFRFQPGEHSTETLFVLIVGPRGDVY